MRARVAVILAACLLAPLPGAAEVVVAPERPLDAGSVADERELLRDWLPARIVQRRPPRG